MGLIVAIVAIALVGLIPGLLLLALMLPVFLVTLRQDPHGQTPMQRVGMRLGWRRARRARSHLYRSGPLGRTPYGTFQLPGLLAASQLSEARDSYDRPFAVLCHPWTQHLTVVLETERDHAGPFRDENRNGHRADIDDDRDPDADDHDTHNYDNHDHLLQSRWCGGRSGRRGVEGEDLVGIERPPRLGMGADRRGRRRRSCGRRGGDTPAPARQGDGASESGAGATAG